MRGNDHKTGSGVAVGSSWGKRGACGREEGDGRRKGLPNYKVVFLLFIMNQ